MNLGRQYRILSDRYLDCVLGDFTSLLWTIGQAPLIAMFIILRWDGLQATDTLHFVVALSAHWFGLINSCREIAKEQTIFKRECLFDISIRAYLGSKLKILALIGLAEMLFFFVLLESNLDLNVNPPLAFACLYALYVAGMAVGLFLSSVARTPAKAVIGVPLMILPQIIFSKFIMPENTLSTAAQWVANATPIKWGYDAFRACESGQIAMGTITTDVVVLLAGSIVLVAATLVALRLSQ